MINYRKIILNPQEKLIKSMKILQKYHCKIVLVCDQNYKLLGIISDGDIRRYLLAGGSLNDQSYKVMNKKPFKLNSKNDKKKNKNILKKNNILCAPVINQDNQVIDFLFSSIQKIEKIKNPVVIMAGGEGKRLRPLTKNIPKPLIKMGSKTILEIIIENLKDYGFTNFIFSVNYLKNKIIDHFGDGSRFDINLKYIKEKEYLGTAGSLSLLKPKPKIATIVLNADIITNIDFLKLLNFHLKHKGIATMAVREFTTDLPYGVINEKNGLIEKINEKPKISNLINAGIYILNPEFFELIPNNKYSDMTTMFNKAIENKKKTYFFPFYESWFEVGREDDLKRIKKIFNE